MKGSSFGYLFKEGFKNVWVNRLMSFASIGTLMACMLLIGCSMLFSMNVNSVIGYMERQNDVLIEVADGLSDDALAELDTRISMIENIYDSMYIDKEQLLEESKAQSTELAELLDGLEGDQNPLYNSYRVRLKDQSVIADTVNQLEALDGVVSVQAPTDVAEIVTSIKRAVSMGGTFIVAILVVVSLVIIGNTIKVTVFNRRKEISIMKCVGATDSFIRMPFFIEGFLIGLISALLAFALLWLGYNYVLGLVSLNNASWIKSAYENMLPFPSIALQMLAYFSGGGIGIGVLGSMFFVNRYLKV